MTTLDGIVTRGAGAGPGRGLAATGQPGIEAAVAGDPRWDVPAVARIAAEQGVAEAAAQAYTRWGKGALAHIHGAFALALHDARRGTTLLACDRAGVHPVFYAVTRERLVFASRADRVAADAVVDDALDPQALLDYLHFHVVPGPITIYRGVRRLQPGEYLVVGAEGEPGVERYWAPDWREGERQGDASVAGELPGVLRTSVGDAIDETSTVGAFLSGGTDSSTVAGLLAEMHGGDAPAYSIGFSADRYDEMDYARIAARHFGLRHRERYVSPEDVVDAVPRVAAHFDQPFGNASAVPAYLCACMARDDGVDRLLAGDGGDELFGGNTRYAKEQLLGAYERIPASLRRGLIEPLVDRTPLDRLPGARKLARYVARARQPMPDRLEEYNLLRRLGPDRVLTAKVLADASPEHPLAMLRETYRDARASTLLNRMLTVDMRFTLADSDLPKVRGACAMAGVDVAFPLLDERVMALAARMPPRDKVRGRRLRVGFKRALRGFLPPAILAKRKQGFGLPFGIWLSEHHALRELAGDSLTALKGRGLVTSELIDELLNERHAEHAAYYGVMIWVLMMLEQWLEAREPRAQAASSDAIARGRS